MLRISLLAAPLLVVGLVAGCGDDGGGGDDAAEAPKNATAEEFCAPFVDMYNDVVAKGEDISNTDAVKIAKDTAEKLEAAGTPEEFVLSDLHDARTRLEEITGARTPDDVLNAIFGKFCIGK